MENLNEALVTFNNTRPKYNNVVIIGGGGGSGKGLINSRLVGIEGKVFNVDDLKDMATKSYLISSRIKQMTGVDIKNLDLRDADNTSFLHQQIDKIGLPKRQLDVFRQSIDPSNKHKPNLIFDVTMKDMPKFSTICDNVERMGYEKENIHIVWVLNKLSEALINKI
jgi:hypothetical protein